MDRQAKKLSSGGKEGENGSENGSELGSNTDSENEEKVRTNEFFYYLFNYCFNNNKLRCMQFKCFINNFFFVNLC